MIEKTFVTCCSQDYYCWFEPYYKSVKAIYPNARIALHTVNIPKPTNGDWALYLQKITPPKTPPPSLGDIIICNKMKYLLQTMQTIPSDLYILTDIDMVLNKELVELEITKKTQFDIAGYRPKGDKVAGGFIAIRPTPLSIQFVTDLSAYLLEPPIFFDKDQAALAHFYNMYGAKGLKWKQLGPEYLDPTCSKDSYMWSAHKIQYGTKEQKLQRFKERIC